MLTRIFIFGLSCLVQAQDFDYAVFGKENTIEPPFAEDH
jgi:hypothetical protein